MSPLDPHNLTPTISLNRVRVMDLPDLAVKSSETMAFPNDTYNPPIRVNLTP